MPGSGATKGSMESPMSKDSHGSKVSLQFWGTRGSIPSPGSATARYGGNTSCVELRLSDGTRAIFDAGSGLRPLGNSLLASSTGLNETIFLTHFHWDHIQGFPFFAPLYRTNTHLEIIGPSQHGIDIRSLFAGQMGPVYFPVPFQAIAADLDFHHLNEGVWQGRGYRVRALRVRHPSYTVGYRIEVGEHVITYVPDNELVAGAYEVPDDWAEQFREFVRGSDVLIHDAMFTADEYPMRVGWGHSTFDQVVDLALNTDVRRLFFFHHSPERSDEELETILDEMRERVSSEGGQLRIDAADEGEEFALFDPSPEDVVGEGMVT
jgi:phosphoribosyl 1,2-cyclic phosphodiesterase